MAKKKAKKKGKNKSGLSMQSLQKQITAVAAEQVVLHGLIIKLRERVELGP